jgi:acyl dehydratase
MIISVGPKGEEMIALEQVFDRVEFDVEAGKIAEFVHASFVEDPVHTSTSAAHERGLAGIAATPTHTVVAGHYRDQRAMVAQLGLDLARVVVGSVRWRYVRPLVSGDHLVGTRMVVSDEQRPNSHGGTMRLVTLDTEYTDPAGATVVRVREVIIERPAPA